MHSIEIGLPGELGYTGLKGFEGIKGIKGIFFLLIPRIVWYKL